MTGVQTCALPISVPGGLNGVADGPLHPGAGGAELLGHGGVQLLGDGDVGIPDGEQDGLPQIKVAQDMSRDPQIVNGLGDHQADLRLWCGRLFPAGDALDQHGNVAGLGDEIICSEGGGLRRDLRAGEAGQQKNNGAFVETELVDLS